MFGLSFVGIGVSNVVMQLCYICLVVRAFAMEELNVTFI
jgi:hypothetical protein